MFQLDPWEMVADCERSMRISIDPVHRENQGNIREIWISLANPRSFLSEHEFAKEAEAIVGFHTNSERATTCLTRSHQGTILVSMLIPPVCFCCYQTIVFFGKRKATMLGLAH